VESGLIFVGSGEPVVDEGWVIDRLYRGDFGKAALAIENSDPDSPTLDNGSAGRGTGRPRPDECKSIGTFDGAFRTGRSFLGHQAAGQNHRTH